MITFLLYSCGEKQKSVERIFEGSVEIIRNNLEPYKIKREPRDFVLKDEFLIDIENEEILKIGLTKIILFEADEHGNVYILGGENRIYKFDKTGNLIKVFGGYGQGPGEFQLVVNLKCLDDKIIVTDRRNMKFAIFQKDGTYINEKKIDIASMDKAILLRNGNYLIGEIKISPSLEKFINVLSLYDSNFEKIRDIDKHEFENPFKSNQILAIYHNTIWDLSRDKIYTGYQDQIYEIRVFDLNGNPIRVIRKRYKKVPLSEEYKEKYMNQFKSAMFANIKGKFYFPKNAPAYHSFISDNKGRIFVMTYEVGKKEGEYMFDIFNPEGILILRKSLWDFSENEGIRMLIRNDRLYCLKEAPTGYQKFYCYRIEWQY